MKIFQKILQGMYNPIYLMNMVHHHLFPNSILGVAQKFMIIGLSRYMSLLLQVEPSTLARWLPATLMLTCYSPAALDTHVVHD